MANWEKDGVPFRNPLVVDGTQIFNPTAEQLRNAGYEQVVRTPPKGSTVFTKLQIRRALRALGQEAVLDTALANEAFRKDWNDAQDINLEDNVFRQALAAQGITERLMRQVIIQIRRNL